MTRPSWFLCAALLIAACCSLGLAVPRKPLSATPAKLTHITVWLPDGRAVVAPPGSASFKELAQAINAITPFSNEVARQAMMAQVHWGPLFPAWTVNPGAVCVEVEYDQSFTGGYQGGGATRLALGSGRARLPETGLIIAAGRWNENEWLQLPSDRRGVEPRAPALGRAVAHALARLKPSPSPLLPAPNNLSVSTLRPEAKRLEKAPVGIWIGLYYYTNSLRAAANEWAPASAMALGDAVAVLRCEFKAPLRIESGGTVYAVRAFVFASEAEGKRGTAWVETDRGVLRFKADVLHRTVPDMLRDTYRVPW